MALHWNSTLSVGVPEIDAQHRELFERVDRLLDAVLRRDRSEAGRLLDFLREWVVIHFAAEERLMEGCAYPAADREAHRAEHAAFAAALRGLDEEFRRDGPTAALVLALERRAVAWLSDHVYRADAALGRFALARRPGLAARSA